MPRSVRQYFQETHPQELFRECSHYCEIVTTPAQLPRVLQSAMRTAIGSAGRRGCRPARRHLLDRGPVPARSRSVWPRRGDPAGWPRLPPRPASEQASRLTILRVPVRRGARRGPGAGRQTEGAGPACLPRQRVGRVRQSLRRRHERTARLRLGLPGDARCDALLLLGTDFPYRPFYPSMPPLIQIDSRVAHLGHRAPLEPSVWSAPSRKPSRHCCPSCNASKTESPLHRQRTPAHYASACKGLGHPGHAISAPPARAIHPQYLAKMIDQIASDDAIFTVDVGTPTLWAARYLHDERQAATAWLLQSRFDGKRNAAGARRPGRASRGAR